MSQNSSMKRQDFSFELPESLIAQAPLAERSESRLFVYNRADGSYKHDVFSNIGEYLRPNDLLIMNNTRVMAARLYAKKETGGKLELLIERVLSSTQFVAQIKASKAPKTGTNFLIGEDLKVQVISRRGSMFVCELTDSRRTVFEMIEKYGHIPLPPYIDRSADSVDYERYQTVYAEHNGAVAAPTAGLHFDLALIDKLKLQGVNVDFVTLHVGAGTFQPVRVDDISQHQMHSEWLEVKSSVVEKIKKTKSSGGRVIAVGTTSVRSLETAALDGEIAPYEGESEIFLYPGKSFNVVDAMVTNFHLPESSLVMLVAAFIGTKEVMALYQEAVAQGYRFFSYGDASLLL